MARSKSKKKTLVRRLTSGLVGMGGLAFGPARTLVLCALVVGALAAAASTTWRSVSERVLSSHDYILSAEDLELSEQPPWIRTKIAQQAFECLTTSGEQLSIMDDDLTERVVQELSVLPWVKKVREVSKHHPARIRVELEYRRPVCMVMVQPKKNIIYLFPVDEHGFVLPGEDDFTLAEANQYPCLNLIGLTAGPVGKAGEPWGDERVVGAAEIAAAFGLDNWKKLGLKYIEPDKPQRSAYHSVYEYVLLTRGGTKIIWGRPPGSELPSEYPAANKITNMIEFVEVNGSLDGSKPRVTLDFSGRKGLPVHERVAMKKTSQDSPAKESTTKSTKPEKSKKTIRLAATKKKRSGEKSRR